MDVDQIADATPGHGGECTRPDPTPRWTDATPYEKLQAGQIRLLRVKAGNTLDGSSLRCTLSTHDLSVAPPFSALSYTWGPAHRDIHQLRLTPGDTTCQIECNRDNARVGKNLHDFLTHCADSPSPDLQGYLWIDALSINQGDLQERSEQVKLMGNIYQTATKVVVWLGPEDHSTQRAIDLMKAWLQLDEAQRKTLHSGDVEDDHANKLLDKAGWQALVQFFQREWFNRAWIIQEVVFANSVTLLCGKHSMSWDDLRLFSQGLATSAWTMLFKQSAAHAQARGGITSGHNTPARLAAAQRTWRSGHDNRFLYALIRARSSKSENLRDKVYSQLGLGGADIFPDYKVSVADVYITVATYILKHSASLLLLTCVEGRDFQVVPGLPSWVPDWSVTRTLGLRLTGYTDFHAALDRPKSKDQNIVVEHGGKHILTIEATKLDEIVEICETKPEMRKDLHASGVWRMLLNVSSSYANTRNPQSREEVVWRTLMTNRAAIDSASGATERQYPANTEPFQSSFRAWVLWRLVVAPDMPSTFPVSSSTQSSLLPTDSEIRSARERSRVDPEYLATLSREASIYDVHYSHATAIRPFLTRQGYFGTGTQCLQMFDTAWIVPGCPVPLILRRVEGSLRYRLVGGAYIHGFMNGELFEGRNPQFEMVSLE